MRVKLYNNCKQMTDSLLEFIRDEILTIEMTVSYPQGPARISMFLQILYHCLQT